MFSEHSCTRKVSGPVADIPNVYARDPHLEMFSLLKIRIQQSITSASAGRTVSDPSRAAEYAANALLEWPEGQQLICRLAAYIEQRAGG